MPSLVSMACIITKICVHKQKDGQSKILAQFTWLVIRKNNKNTLWGLPCPLQLKTSVQNYRIFNGQRL